MCRGDGFSELQAEKALQQLNNTFSPFLPFFFFALRFNSAFAVATE